jgi:hypothetical protein
LGFPLHFRPIRLCLLEIEFAAFVFWLQNKSSSRKRRKQHKLKQFKKLFETSGKAAVFTQFQSDFLERSVRSAIFIFQFINKMAKILILNNLLFLFMYIISIFNFQ